MVSGGQYISGFDPHFKIYHELMAFKVREILLVSSPYDAYIMEEDGSLASRIINEYHGLNLSEPPRITRVPTGEQALKLLESDRFDLVVTMPHLGGMDGYSFGYQVKKHHPELPVILLAHSVRDTLPGGMNGNDSAIDNTYVWCCDSDLLLAIIKNTEDRVNVDYDTRRAMVRIILLVEDSPLHRSTILPILYNEVVLQTQSVLAEGLNEQHRLLKMRARPKILCASSFEEALELFVRYRPYIFAVISDVRFPMGGKLTDGAGFELVRILRREMKDLALLMLSTEEKNNALARMIPAGFISKSSSNLREEIHNFFLTYLGFGDFVFRMPDGTVLGRASSLRQFENMLRTVPEASLRYHAAHNHFSNWVMARAEIALASRLHKHHFSGIENGEDLREDLVSKVHALRKLRQKGVVAQFSRNGFDPDITDFVRIGHGSMGGKARGIAFVASELQQAIHQKSALAAMPVTIPQTCVITNDGFDDFVRINRLSPPDEPDDSLVAEQFLQARLPDWLEEDLRAWLARIHYPLSVRSSSMLEDAQFRPYAGLYNTFMLINDSEDFEERLRQLVRAVKLVYASTWFEGPRAFSRSIGQTRKDSMAVIIQQVAGRRYGDYYYPAISGVAQSFNYYPIAPMRPEDGIVHVALGFGKTVVEGERCLRFSPAWPEHLPQFSTVDDMLQNGQTWFYSLDCSRNALFSLRRNNLVRRSIDEAADEFPVRILSSTYFPDEHRIRDADLPGPKVLTFASILKYGHYPLPKILRELLAFGREGMGCEVEIEFAVDMDEDPARSVFYFLQIRPIVTTGESRRVQISDREWKEAILRSSQALGHGFYTGIADIVYVIPEKFDAAATREIAAEVGRINRELHREQRPYLLIGPGRWGTADPWLGIPVLWGDISGVGIIVELQGCGLQAEPSQGSHFFQNITSLGIPYLMVENSDCAGGKAGEQGGVDWTWIYGLETVRETGYVRHVRAAAPFELKVDGRSARAVVLAAGDNMTQGVNNG